MPGTVLIIGYGNPLRGDDALGPVVAEALLSDAGGGVRVVICHQLTPELAECIAAVELVVFVDAAVDILPGTVSVRALRDVSAPAPGLVHTAEPAALLYLARTLYGRAADAFLVTIGAGSLALHEGLSETAAAAVPAAVATVRRLVSEHLRNA